MKIEPLAIAYVATAASAALVQQFWIPLAAIPIKIIVIGLLFVAVARPWWAGERSRLRSGLALGFLFSILGDVLLQLYFLPGIAAFLIAHVCYLWAMGWNAERLSHQVPAAVPALAAIGVMFFILHERIPEPLFIPVTLYMTVIGLMLARACVRGLVLPADAPARSMMVGAAFFVVSDSCIAINRWVNPLPFSVLVVLSTYYVAQWLIFRGLAQPEQV